MSTPNPTHIDVIAKHSLEFSEFYVQWRCRCEHPEARWSGAGISVRPLHAAHVVSKLTDAGYSIVQVPVVGYKAVGETDAQRYLNIANRVEDGYHVGGSNSRGAVTELLRRVAGTLPAAEGENP